MRVDESAGEMQSRDTEKQPDKSVVIFAITSHLTTVLSVHLWNMNLQQNASIDKLPK